MLKPSVWASPKVLASIKKKNIIKELIHEGYSLTVIKTKMVENQYGVSTCEIFTAFLDLYKEYSYIITGGIVNELRKRDDEINAEYS